LRPLKENWRTFRKELDAILADDNFRRAAYSVTTHATRAMRSDPKLWKTLAFMVHGRDPGDLVKEFNVKSVVTPEMRAYVKEHHFLETRPFLRDFAAVPEHGVVSMFFSVFEPGAKLGLHINNDPYMYRAHLGIRVPQGDVRFKVCDETVSWREGELLVFTPTNPHTAWNLSDEPRVVLIVDFYKPEDDREKMVALEREQFARQMARDPQTRGMSGGMFDLDEATKRRYAVPAIEEAIGRQAGG
jgi:aspartyl/asparaginyl beta-hydroxylase (cupin superfamily)